MKAKVFGYVESIRVPLDCENVTCLRVDLKPDSYYDS